MRVNTCSEMSTFLPGIGLNHNLPQSVYYGASLDVYIS